MRKKYSYKEQYNCHVHFASILSEHRAICFDKCLDFIHLSIKLLSRSTDRDYIAKIPDTLVARIVVRRKLISMD